MTQTTSRMIGCALTLAALFTTGCHVQLGTTPGIGVKPPVTANSATGNVQVAFQGLGAYKTLATRYDIHRVELTLQPERGKSQFRKVGLKELQQGSVNLDFKKVATGQAQLNVTAFDAGNQAIGQGYSSTYVASGTTAFIHVAVKMNGEAGTGNVNALITFEDGLGEEDLFYRSDRNHDGYLDRAEYQEAYHRQPWAIDMPAYPAVMPACAEIAPVDPPQPFDTPTAAIARCPMPPVMDPIFFSFNQKDWNGDGLLSLDEFLGRMYAMPVAGTEPAQAE